MSTKLKFAVLGIAGIAILVGAFSWYSSGNRTTVGMSDSTAQKKETTAEKQSQADIASSENSGSKAIRASSEEKDTDNNIHAEKIGKNDKSEEENDKKSTESVSRFNNDLDEDDTDDGISIEVESDDE